MQQKEREIVGAGSKRASRECIDRADERAAECRRLGRIALGVIALTIGGATLAVAQSGTSPSQPRSNEVRREAAKAPKVMVLALHADWCGKCQMMGPKLMKDVAPALGNDGALFVKADQTDRDSPQAQYLLSALGLGDLWREHAGKTGYALLIDLTSKRVVGTLHADESPEAMKASIAKAMRGR